MKNDNLEINRTALRVMFDPKEINIRTVARKIKHCSKVYVPPNDDALAIISYDTPEAAEKALNILRYNPAIKLINFHFRRVGNPTVTLQNGNDGTTTPTPATPHIPETPHFQQLPNLPKCAKCFAWPVVKRCSICGTSYCDVNCQKQDWPLHKEHCMPNLFLDLALEAMASQITAEQKMQYYAQQKPPIAAYSPNPLEKQEKLNEPANLHQDRDRACQQQGDPQQKRLAVQPGEKQQNNKRYDSSKEKDGTLFRQDFQRENSQQEKYQQKEKSQQMLPQQESARKQSQQGNESRQKQPQKEAQQKQIKQELQNPQQRHQLQEPQQNQLKQEPQKHPEQNQFKQEQKKQPEKNQLKQEPQKHPEQNQMKQKPHKQPEQNQFKQEQKKQPEKNQLKKESQKHPEQNQMKQEPHKQPEQNQMEQEQQQQKSQQKQPQQASPTEQQQLLNKLPLRALVAKAKEDSKRRVLRQGSFPPVGSEVKIAHVAENTMFIFESGSDSNGPSSQYLKVVERCFVGGEGAKKYLIQAPVAGDIVYAPFEEVYYRAEVNGVEGDTATVFFTDFGNTETLEWKNFKEIEDPEIKYADRLIHEVQIEHLPTFTDFVRMKLQALEGEAFELTKITDIPNSKAKKVELRHSKELYFLSEMIRKLSKDNDELEKKQTASPGEKIDTAEQTVAPPDPKSYVPVSISELSEVCIPYGDDIKLMIIDAAEVYDAESHRLAVIDIARNDAFAMVLAEVCKYGEADSNVYSPEELHHLCLVQWDGIWSRAVPLAIGSKEETSIPYCLLDLGIIKTVESKHVRRFPYALSRKLYVADCIVQNPETLCKLATAGVQNTELLTGKIVKVNVIPKKNNSDENEIQEIRIISVI
ncbi:uncharacterized protein LOC126568972 [Anopheles aquasalis]|uniref:uncharacterized protein LOC126568972 n=1 Tax=Anopheles aquasalis TaxID=42839 RepID=UPI00215A6DAD|nr:uncharacterized protein LOC126568972 [Anopheles aquasalis]